MTSENGQSGDSDSVVEQQSGGSRLDAEFRVRTDAAYVVNESEKENNRCRTENS